MALSFTEPAACNELASRESEHHQQLAILLEENANVKVQTDNFVLKGRPDERKDLRRWRRLQPPLRNHATTNSTGDSTLDTVMTSGKRNSEPCCVASFVKTVLSRQRLTTAVTALVATIAAAATMMNVTSPTSLSLSQSAVPLRHLLLLL